MLIMGPRMREDDGVAFTYIDAAFSFNLSKW